MAAAGAGDKVIARFSWASKGSADIRGRLCERRTRRTRCRRALSRARTDGRGLGGAFRAQEGSDAAAGGFFGRPRETTEAAAAGPGSARPRPTRRGSFLGVENAGRASPGRPPAAWQAILRSEPLAARTAPIPLPREAPLSPAAPGTRCNVPSSCMAVGCSGGGVVSSIRRTAYAARPFSKPTARKVCDAL